MEKHTLIIAEAGVNHNGNIELAKRLIDVAYDAGADIVKFQTGLPQNVISVHATKADYQVKNTMDDKESQLDMANRISLQYKDFITLKNYSETVGIQFLSTPFDIESTNFLHNIGMPFWKIPSGEITNYPYLVNIAKTKMNVVMSTGMSTMKEVRDAVEILYKYGTPKICLLHCNTEYPTPYDDVNLMAMNSLKEEFNLSVGYSDHTLGIEVPIAAVAMGAEIIEKHFTLDKKMQGPDHAASLEPNELKEMVRAIRIIEKCLGTGIKEPSKSERKNMEIARKSIVAREKIKKGEILTEKNLTTKRPGTGLSPMLWNDVIGKKAIRDFNIDELIEV